MTEQVPDIDTSRPHPARVYDYFIGGKNNFAADRETADKVLRRSPNARIAPRENRAFLGRAVQFLAANAGVRQFLDIGTGLPTTGSVHEVAQSVDPLVPDRLHRQRPAGPGPRARPADLRPQGRTAYLEADIRDPKAILAAPATRDLLDFSQPVGLLLVGILHLLADADNPPHCRGAGRRPAAGELRRRLAPDHAARPGTDGGQSGGDARCRDHHAEARLRRVRRPRLHRPGPRAARRGAGVGVAAEGRPALPAPSEVNIYGGVARKP